MKPSKLQSDFFLWRTGASIKHMGEIVEILTFSFSFLQETSKERLLMHSYLKSQRVHKRHPGPSCTESACNPLFVLSNPCHAFGCERPSISFLSLGMYTCPPLDEMAVFFFRCIH